MTVSPEITGIPTDVAGPYRAKDIEMAATVDVARRLVLITGAIDSNDHDILVRVELPAPGRWQILKSETNLTDSSWSAWQITFGEGTRVATDPSATHLCRQLPSLYVAPDRERLCFYAGEIRPGEAVLKVFTVDAEIPRIVMSHNRPIDPIPWPIEPIEPVEPIDPGRHHLLGGRSGAEPQHPEVVRRGFPARPYIETFLPVTVIGSDHTP